MKRRLALVAVLAAAGVALAGCLPQEPAAVPTPTPTVTAPEPEPTPSATTEPTSPAEPDPVVPGPLDPDAVTDAVISKDAARTIALLGDPVRMVGPDGDANRPASEATADLDIALRVGEVFKPAPPETIERLGNSQYADFAEPDAVVFEGDLGTILAFLPGAYLRVPA